MFEHAHERPALIFKLCLILAVLLVSAGLLVAQSGVQVVPQPGRMPLLMPDDFKELHLTAWRIELATPDSENPLVEGDAPWDAGGVGIHGSVFKDPMRREWRAYVVCTTAEQPSSDWPKPWGSEQGRKRRLCTYESDDGIHWKRPQLGIVPYGSYRQTNILMRLNEGTSAYASIFTNPEDSNSPYQMYLLRETSVEGKPPRGKSGYYVYRSHDGYRWNLAEGPIADPMKGDLSFFYKLGPSQYVAYYRLAAERQATDHVPPYESDARRSIYRAISSDGIIWHRDNTMELTADELDHRDTQYQELVPLRVRGGFIATITMFHPLSQTQDVRIAASRDGSHWWFPDRRPALPNAPLGDYGGGMIWQSQNLIVQDGKIYMYYGASEGTHRQISDTLAPSKQVAYLQTVIVENHSFLPFNTALCRAFWQYDRLYALISSAGGPTVGDAITKPQPLGGKQLWVNIFTRPAKKSAIPGFDQGYLQVELLDADNQPIPGFTRKDSDPLSGDYHAIQVRWKGGGTAPQSAVSAKFYLKRVFLYGYEFR